MVKMTRLAGSSLLLALTLFATEVRAFECPAARGPRGHARVLNGTVVTDTGTPLRGLRFSLDLAKELPAKAQLQRLPCRGINALHVYAENAGKYPLRQPGYNEISVLKLVQFAQENGMYLVLTVGGPPHREFATKFWEFYAPRLIMNPHVIFELQNEPTTTQPMPPEWVDFETNTYSFIRSLQPDYGPKATILLFSYPFFDNSSAVLQDIAQIESRINVDWTYTAIAFHGYSGKDPTGTTIRQLFNVQPKIGVMETELACFDDPDAGRQCSTWSSTRPRDGLYPPLLDLYERDLPPGRGNTPVSWLSFLELALDETSQPNLDLEWNSRLTSYNYSWIPDSGQFPVPYAINGPSSATIHAGQTIDLRVTITNLNNRVVCYQWYQNGVLMVGERGYILRVKPLQAGTYTYRVDIGDSCTPESRTATLTVLP